MHYIYLFLRASSPRLNIRLFILLFYSLLLFIHLSVTSCFLLSALVSSVSVAVMNVMNVNVFSLKYIFYVLFSLRITRIFVTHSLYICSGSFLLRPYPSCKRSPVPVSFCLSLVNSGAIFLNRPLLPPMTFKFSIRGTRHLPLKPIASIIIYTFAFTLLFSLRECRSAGFHDQFVYAPELPHSFDADMWRCFTCRSPISCE